VLLLIGAYGDIRTIADLPLLPAVRSPQPAAHIVSSGPYTRDVATHYCELALRHPPFPRIPFAKSKYAWLVQCIQRFIYPNTSAATHAETLVCEMRAIDVLAEAARERIDSALLPPRQSILAKCEHEYRTKALIFAPELPSAPPPRPAPRRPTSREPRPQERDAGMAGAAHVAAYARTELAWKP